MTFEKHLRSVSRAASQRLFILRKSWQVFHYRSLLGRCFRGFVMTVLEYCSAVWCSAADAHLRLLDRVVSGASFLTGVCLSVTSQIVALWQYYVCCTRSGVTRCTLFVVLFLCRMCRFGLHAALWSHIDSLMRLLAAEPRSIAGLLFPCQHVCGTILVTLCSMVWDWRVSRAGPMPFYWPSWSLIFCLLLFSLFFHSVGWCCGVGVFGLIGC